MLFDKRCDSILTDGGKGSLNGGKMRSVRKGTSGFTLLELLIVVVILGVLAGLSINTYTSSAEKSRRQEAISMLSAAKDSAGRYYAGNVSSYAGMTFAKMDFDPTNTAGEPAGAVRHYTYTMPAADVTATTYTVTATRNAAHNGNGTDTVTIRETGVIT